MEAQLEQIDVYRRMSPAERVRAGCGLHDFAHQRVVQHLSQMHTDRSEREILIMAARRFLGDAARVL